MAEKKLHILLVLTGGTIGTCVSEDGKRRITPESGAMDPLLFQLIRKERPELKMDVDVVVPYQVLSEHMNLDYLNRLGETFRESQIQNYDGVLITHGSDTLAFTAAFLGELLHGCPVPVFLLASQRPLEDPESNGLENSLTALEMIRSGWYTQRDPEEVKCAFVYVPYRNSDGVMYIHRATELQQCEPGTDDFFSEGMRAVPQMYREYAKETGDGEPSDDFTLWKVPEVRLSPDVLLIHPYVGIRYDCINLSGIRAVLHTLYHSSTAPKELTGFLDRCKAESVACYILPCDREAYHYETTTELLRGGAIPLSGMTEERAYMRLLLGKTGDESGNK